MRRIIFQFVCGGLFVMLLLTGSRAVAAEKVLYTFPGGNRGYDPEYGVVLDRAGNAYGTTCYGGTYGWGTVYELKPSKHGWDQIVLYNFEGSSDGENPRGNLLIDKNGNVYGTTPTGGASNGGTVFELQKAQAGWTHVVLYDFCSLNGCADGAEPEGLTFDKAGNLYGTTSSGGRNRCYEGGCGTVYELSSVGSSWKETVIHSFNNNGDGYYPNPGVTFGESGSLYGTTASGGGYGYGLIFVLKPGKTGWKEALLFAFDGLQNHRDPGGYLTIDSAGNIFGTTTGYYFGGCGSQCGSVFRLARSNGQWVETDVYLFDGTHGAGPNPGLIIDSAGNFYGSAYQGGSNNAGVIFQLQPGKVWTINLLYQFSGEGGDAIPNSGLVFGINGNLYGTTGTPNYGDEYYGEVYEVAP